MSSIHGGLATTAHPAPTSSSTPSSSSSSTSSSSSPSSSKRVAQVKASGNSKLNSLISPRSFKFPGEKLLKKIGNAGGMTSHKEKENTLTLSTSSVATRRRSKRHHSLDDLEDSIRRNVSFGRKGNKARDAIASDSEDDKASIWDGSYGDDTSSSHSSDTDSDDWRDPTWVLDEWEEEERRLWREKKQREKEEQERREREAAAGGPAASSSDIASSFSITPTTSGEATADRRQSVAQAPTPTPTSTSTSRTESLATTSKSASTPTSPTPASKAAHQRRNSRVEIIATDPIKAEGEVRSSSREWPLRRARSFSETGEARAAKSKLDPSMKKRSLSSHSLPSASVEKQQGKLKRRVSQGDQGANTDDDVIIPDDDHGCIGEEKSSSKREKKRKSSIKRKGSSGILSTIAGIKHSGDGGGTSASSEGSGFLQSVKRRGRSLSGKSKDKDKGIEREKEKDRERERAAAGNEEGRSPTTQKLSRSDEKVRSHPTPTSAFDLDDLRSPRHSVCVTRPTGGTSPSPAHGHHSPAHAYAGGMNPVSAMGKAPAKSLTTSNLALFPKRERASSTPYVPRLKLPSHAPAAPKSYFSSTSSSQSLSPASSPLSSPAASPSVSKSTTSLPYHHGGSMVAPGGRIYTGASEGLIDTSSLPSSPRTYLGTTPASSPSATFLHMPHRTPPLSPKGDNKYTKSSMGRQARSSSLSGASGSEGEERLTWSNVWQSTTVEREMEIEAEVELEMEIEERARSDELDLNLNLNLGLGSGWQPIGLQPRTESRERLNRESREREKSFTTATTTTTTTDSKKRSDRHSGGAVSTVSNAGIDMRSPEVLRWSGEMSRRSYRRSSLTGSQSPVVSSKDPREEALASREYALRENEEKVRQEREEFERERSDWEQEREKLLLELKRLRILQQDGLAPPKDIAPNDRLLWSPQHDLTTVVSAAASPSANPLRSKHAPGVRASAESQQQQKKPNTDHEEEEAVEEGENAAAVSCARCQEKEETIRKLERDLKRIKYLYYEANGKLMEGTMRDKNRERHQSGGASPGSLHRSESAESAASMAATSTTPRSRQLKETASLIFHESSSKSKHRKSERGHTPRGSPVSPRAGGSGPAKS